MARKKSVSPAGSTAAAAGRESPPTVRDDARSSALRRLGLARASTFLTHDAVRRAREIAAIARAAGTDATSSDVVELGVGQPPLRAGDALARPVDALPGVTPSIAAWFASMGVHSVADLAALAQEADQAVAQQTLHDTFAERPSAPPELMPEMIGSVSSSVRFSSFVEEVSLDGVRTSVEQECAKPTALSATFTKTPYALSDIFAEDACQAVRLGFLLDHRQRFINLGTSLGEIAHSLCLAPGESRHIATINWRRRQLAQLEQRGTVQEELTARFVQNRALEEVTGAVAAEHQSGGTRTEANTAVTAGALVGAFGAVGAVGGGVTGAIIGGVMGTAPAGSMSVPGALAGGAVGAAAGGVAGMAAGGLVWSGAQALGMIESNSEGDREVAGRVNQHITLSTSQTASVSRSLWGSSVLEDEQAEEVNAQTRVVTNYNHMHALNIEYFEVLQRYLASISIEKAEPVLYLPFTHLPFTTDFAFVRDYWDAIREHLDEDLQHQGDQYFVTEDTPPAPDLLPVPPMPTPPGENAVAEIRRLMIKVVVVFPTFGNIAAAISGWTLECEVRTGSNTHAKPHSSDDVPAAAQGAHEWRFWFNTITPATNVQGVRIRISGANPFGVGVTYNVEAAEGVLGSGGEETSLVGEEIASNRTYPPTTGQMGDWVPRNWKPADHLEHSQDNSMASYDEAVAERDAIIEENEQRSQAYEVLVRDIERFRQRLRLLILRRRHFFTRVVLNAVEPEEIESLLRSVVLSAGDQQLRVRDIAHTRPLGMTTGAFVLRMKTYDAPQPQLVSALKNPGAARLVRWPGVVAERYGTAKARAEYSRTEQVYMPTGGLFAEAILGRANGAEYLDMERYFDWQSSPIPHQATAINPLSTNSRYQQPPDLRVQVPDGTINMINPVNFPDSTGLRDTLAAVQNGNMFRDMSKAQELTSILGSLAQLAGTMGQSASQMTGAAGQQALQQAGEMGKSVADMTRQMMADTMTQAGGAFSSLTKQGATLNQVRKQFPGGRDQDDAVRRVTGVELPTGSVGNGGGGTSTGTDDSTPPGTGDGNAPPTVPPPSPPPQPFTTQLPPLPAPGQTPDAEPQTAAVEKSIGERLGDLLVPDANGLPSADPEQFTTLLEEWFTTGVRPGLLQAANDDRVLNSALTGWFRWLGEISWLGLDPDAGTPLGAAMAEARVLARAGLRNAVLQANERAAETNQWLYLLDALRWASEAEYYTLAEGGDRLTIQEVLADFDLRITLFNVQVPPAVAIDTPTLVRFGAGLQIADNTPITGEALEWSLQVSGGSASPPSAGIVNSAGGFTTTVTRTNDDFEIVVRVVFPYFGGVAVRTLEQSFRPELPS